uniref:Uncharacterized protein n=1 Tax=Helianthus annuus TaxID=4232 RepID=A0A251V1M2_HELAN
MSSNPKHIHHDQHTYYSKINPNPSFSFHICAHNTTEALSSLLHFRRPEKLRPATGATVFAGRSTPTLSEFLSISSQQVTGVTSGHDSDRRSDAGFSVKQLHTPPLVRLVKHPSHPPPPVASPNEGPATALATAHGGGSQEKERDKQLDRGGADARSLTAVLFRMMDDVIGDRRQQWQW